MNRIRSHVFEMQKGNSHELSAKPSPRMSVRGVMGRQLPIQGKKIALATETGVSATHVQAGLFGLLTHNTVLLRQSVHMCKSSAYSNAADDASMRKACKSQNSLCLICCTMSYALCTARLLWAE